MSRRRQQTDLFTFSHTIPGQNSAILLQLSMRRILFLSKACDIQHSCLLYRYIADVVLTVSACGLFAPRGFCYSTVASMSTATGMETAQFHTIVFAFDSTPGDILKILSDMSWDTLFLLVGLAFVAVAVLGNISGKISPGRGGRIAAGFVGAGLIVGGFWYHAQMHGFKITLVDVSPPQSQIGPCPLKVNLQGIVDSSGSGDVIYYFEFSNGNASESYPVSFKATGSQIVPGTWTVHEALKDAWVQLHIVAPTKQSSQRSKPFSVVCSPSSDSAAHSPTSAGADNSFTTPSPTPPTYAVNDATDSFALDSVLPPSGTYLKRGQPITFDMSITYNLVSADSAILSISTAQLRNSPAACAGSGELSDAVQLRIVRGKHRDQVKLTWSGDTGLSTKGRVYGSGYVSFVPMFWAIENGTRGKRLNVFPTDANYCYQFGS
jgi:hypothetical protein